MLPDDDLVAGVVAEVKRLREEREQVLAEIAARQQAVRPDRSDVEQLALEMKDFARHLREMYEAGSVEAAARSVRNR